MSTHIKILIISLSISHIQIVESSQYYLNGSLKRPIKKFTIEYTEDGYLNFLNHYCRASQWLFEIDEYEDQISAQLLKELPVYKAKGIDLAGREGKAFEIALAKHDYFLLYQLCILHRIYPSAHESEIIEHLIDQDKIDALCQIIFTLNLKDSPESILARIDGKKMKPSLALFIAVNSNQYELAHKILEMFPEVTPDECSYVYAYGASKYGTEFMKLLERYGAELNTNTCDALAKDLHECSGWCDKSILDIAIQYGNKDGIAYLINKGFSVDKNHQVINCALRSESPNIEIIRMLYQAGALIDDAHIPNITPNLFLALNQPDKDILDFVVSHIQNFECQAYQDALVHVTSSPFGTIATIESFKKKHGIKFEAVLDRCLMILATLPEPQETLIRYFLKNGAKPTEGLKWFLYNNKENIPTPFFEYQFNSDVLYADFLSKPSEENRKRLKILAQHVLPKDQNKLASLVREANSSCSATLLHTTLFTLINQQPYKQEFDHEGLLAELTLLVHNVKSELKNLARQCASPFFLNYCENRMGLLENILKLENMEKIKNVSLVMRYASIFNNLDVIKCVKEELDEEDFKMVVNVRSESGFVPLSYAAQWGNQELVLQLISITEKKSDIIVALLLAQRYHPELVHIFIHYLLAHR